MKKLNECFSHDSAQQGYTGANKRNFDSLKTYTAQARSIGRSVEYLSILSVPTLCLDIPWDLGQGTLEGSICPPLW